MARNGSLEKMTYAELIALRDEIDGLIDQKKAEEKQALKAKLAEMAKEQGFDLDDVFGKGRKAGKVAIKYRDPENPMNTWTGRGRMPRWMAAATKKRGVKKEDFLI